MVKPESRAGSPVRSPSPRGGAAAGNVRKTDRADMHCFNFIKGKCQNGDNCKFAHLSPEVVTELKRAQKATAKAEPKAKAKARAKAEARTAMIQASQE